MKTLEELDQEKRYGCIYLEWDVMKRMTQVQYAGLLSKISPISMEVSGLGYYTIFGMSEDFRPATEDDMDCPVYTPRYDAETHSFAFVEFKETIIQPSTAEIIASNKAKVIS